ncbi:MAG: DUF362 domain-containing protein [Promethearchaeota archaeon]
MQKSKDKFLTGFNKYSFSLPPRFYKIINKENVKNSLLFFTLANLLWLIFRTGTKPSRIVYPCQRAALDNLSVSFSGLIPLSIAPIVTTINSFFSKNRTTIFVMLMVGVISSGIFLVLPTPNPSQEIQLVIRSNTETLPPYSDIYVVNGRPVAHISELITLMSSYNFFFYKSSTVGIKQGPDGLIAPNDVVLVKFNSQWSQRGGTNTDVLKELIQAVISHPDGFVGEIVLADNGQGRGSMNYVSSNAENRSQSTQEVANMFSSMYKVSTYDWQQIRSNHVDEYSEGDLKDGYFVYDEVDPETGIYVSYPKFETEFGTKISFKHGIWNGTGYERRLKVINLPVLKSHVIYGVTASVKNYMGVQSESLANGHSTVGTGGMGTLLVECGLPTLNIIDAIWVNANPYPSSSTGPSTSYNQATRVNILLAGIDPVALDYWAAKYVLYQTANFIGYDDAHTVDPDNTEKSGLQEAFGVWLNLTKNELLRGNYNVTTDEKHMIICQEQVSTISSSTNLTSSQIPGFELVWIILSLMIGILFFRNRKKEHNKTLS